ncbi:hypothetical protein GCM10010439_70470 [Actinocorallia aurantiaca]|uniref:Uncharacterized protein n=1 Tax=Actinocorallia aurantiaca TaxID=46204 RepID=A0ABP6H8Y3_9ACTN
MTSCTSGVRTGKGRRVIKYSHHGNGESAPDKAFSLALADPRSKADGDTASSVGSARTRRAPQGPRDAFFTALGTDRDLPVESRALPDKGENRADGPVEPRLRTCRST